MNADIDSNKQVYNALTKIKGVSYSFSNAVCNVLDMDKMKKIGVLTEQELKKIEDVIKNPANYKLPLFLWNRRKDLDSGQDRHVVRTDINFTKEFDIKRFKTIRCYKGIRHALGLPVRGQSTKHHFRHGKTVGVKKKSLVMQREKETKE